MRSSLWEIKQGDAIEVLKTMPDQCINTCVTFPPYWGLRDYGVDGQLGLEPTPEEYVANLVEVFREVRRVLRDDGTLWLNLGDTYSGSCQTGGVNSISGKGKSQPHVKHKRNTNLKPKDLIGIPWMVAFALRADGWYLRSDCIWHKPNPMPESVTDRPTKAHEYIFLLSKSPTYYYDADSIREPLSEQRAKQAGKLVDPGNDAKKRKKQIEHDKKRGSGGHFDGHKWRMNPLGRNKRSVWTVATQPYPEAHFATFPPKLIEPCILAGTSPKACEICGAPWERVVEREPMEIKRSGNGRTAASGTMTKPAISITTGWRPTCSCENEGKGRCIVLDPFVGSGTTLWVAERFGRDSIGIEINPKYCELVKKRMSNFQQTIFQGVTL